MWRALMIVCGLVAAAPAWASEPGPAPRTRTVKVRKVVRTPTAAREIVPAERRMLPWEAQIPGCQDPRVLEWVTENFAERESKFWNSDLRLVAYEQIRPNAWRPWGLDYIPRRFCQAVAQVSDGRKRQVFYSVREDLGIIGATWGVDFCVVGLDRLWDDAPACRMARP